MLLKCIQNIRERPTFGIAHYKNHESVQNMRKLKANTLTFVYSCSVIGSGGSFRKQFMSFWLKSCDKAMICQIFNFFLLQGPM